MKMEIPLHGIFCGDCLKKNKTDYYPSQLPHNIVRLPVGETKLKHKFIIAVDVKKIEWVRESAGRYSAYAKVTFPCPQCETIEEFSHYLETPVILLSNIGVCKDCQGKLVLKDENIEYIDNDNEATLIVKGILTCPQCMFSEKEKVQIYSVDWENIKMHKEVELDLFEHELRIQKQSVINPNKKETHQESRSHQIIINGNVSESTIIIGDKNRSQISKRENDSPQDSRPT